MAEATGSPETRTTTAARTAPPANPFDVSVSYAALMRIALAMAVLPGLGIGLAMVLVYGLSLPWTAAWPLLAQGHGQVQALGFVLVFIVAVGLQLFPRFLGAPLVRPDLAVWGGAITAASVLLRLVAQPLEPGAAREIALGLAAVGLPVGALTAGTAFHGLSKRSVQSKSGPSAAWRTFVLVGGLSLGGVLLLWAWTNLLLAAGQVIVPEGQDEALIHLELAGFAAGIALGISSRVFGRFLLLRARPSLEPRLPLMAALYGLGLALMSLGWLIPATWAVWIRLVGAAIELAVLLAWVWLIGLYDRPSRASGMPHVTEPTRRWARFAFGLLLVSFAANTALFAREALLGIPASTAELSAARHALAQGFLLPLMVTMAARLLPIYSADVLKRRALLEVTVDLIVAGAIVRVAAELLGGYDGVAGPLVSLGGTLSVVGFTIFAVGLWSSLGRLRKPKANLTG